MTEADILKAAHGGKRGKSSDPTSTKASSNGPNLQNEWIPTEAVRAI